jgi:hypothetical protein
MRRVFNKMETQIKFYKFNGCPNVDTDKNLEAKGRNNSAVIS